MLKADGLVKHYGHHTAVDGISFEVKPGDVLGFLGPNGAGKSTTMKMLTGFLPPSGGVARIGGINVWDDPVAAQSQIGYLPESGPLYGEMTVAEFLDFAADLRLLRGSERRDALERVVEACHLEPVWRQTIDTLSKGFRQRVGLAQAILHNPPYLILDEPTDGLDPNQKREVRQLLAGMGNEKAVILSTHILEEVEAMCNRVIILANGRIVADESLEALLQRGPSLEKIFHELTLGATANAA